MATLSHITEDQKKALWNWVPIAGFMAVIDVLCGRQETDFDNVIFLDPSKLEIDPQREDMSFFRKRSRFDVLRVIHERLKNPKGDMNLSLIDVRTSPLLTRIYSESDLTSGISYWHKEGILTSLAFDYSSQIDAHEDERIEELVADYDWEESTAVAEQTQDHASQKDVFICHASEDKDEFVRPLADALREAGISLWYDEHTVKLGDSLRQSIDSGLATSRFGVVVLSPSFFNKHWPQAELDGLAQREASGRKVILPIWHQISHDEVLKHSPLLAGRAAARSSEPMDRIVAQILDAIGEN